MFKSLIQIAAAMFIFTFGSVGCATTQAGSTNTGPLDAASLRVGITPENPPLIFKLNDKIAGIDADLALRLGKELNMPVEFVEMKWDQLISALIEGKIDLIMSGMSITNARMVRINFTDPYLKSGMVAAIRAEDASKYSSAASIMSSYPDVGVVTGTAGETFVRNKMKGVPKISLLAKVSDAAYELQSRRIDVFIHDAPSVIWLVSNNEASLKGVWDLLSEDSLGWGVSKDNGLLLTRVNAILKKWKEDGTLDQTLRLWLPARYFEKLK